LWIFKNVPQFIALRTKHSRGELRGHLDSRNRTIFSHEANFVDLDTGIAGQRAFQLFGQGTRLRISAGKRSHETRKLRLGKIRGEVNAGDAGAGEQLREAFFRRCGSQRHAVQENLATGRAQEQARVAAVVERRAQLLPRSFKLRHRAHVSKLVQPREL